MDGRGYYQSIRVEGKEILTNSTSPVITTGSKGKLVMPTSMTANDSLLTLKMDDGGSVVLRHKQGDVCITLQVKSLSNQYDTLIYGSLQVGIHETVGDVIGVAQGEDVAFGVQALDIKTNGGIVEEYGAPYWRSSTIKEHQSNSRLPASPLTGWRQPTQAKAPCCSYRSDGATRMRIGR